MRKKFDAIINTRWGKLSSGMERKWNREEAVMLGIKIAVLGNVFDC